MYSMNAAILLYNLHNLYILLFHKLKFIQILQNLILFRKLQVQ
jgi:hypothetical protein